MKKFLIKLTVFNNISDADQIQRDVEFFIKNTNQNGLKINNSEFHFDIEDLTAED